MHMLPIADLIDRDLMADGLTSFESVREDQPTNSLNEDIFSEEDPASTGGIQRQHNTEGYREGVSAGKTEFMQEGFDEGYTIGARFALRVGWVKGACSGLVRVAKMLDEEKEGAEMEGGLVALRKGADEELDMNKVFSGEYFDESGIWKYSVRGVDDEETEEFTFDEVVDSHPLISRWLKIVVEEGKKIGLDIEVPSRS